MSQEAAPKTPLFPPDFLWTFLRAYLRLSLWASWLIVGLGLVLGYLLYQRKAAQPTYYTATLTFMTSEETSTQQSMLNSLLGGAIETFSESSNFKIEELLITRKFLQIVLFTPVTIKEGYETAREDYLINHYMYLFWYQRNPEAFNNPEEYFFFSRDTTPLDQRKFNREEGTRILGVYNQLINQQYSRFSTPSSDIVTLSFQSDNEEFSSVFLHVVFESINTYYTDKTVEKQKRLYEATCERRDTLYTKMRAAEYDYYSYLDKNQSSAVSEVAIRKFALQKNLMTLMEAYFMAVKNAEATGFALDQKTPVMQSIDLPMYPLPASIPNPTLHGIIGLFGGMILAALLLAMGLFLKLWGWAKLGEWRKQLKQSK